MCGLWFVLYFVFFLYQMSRSAGSLPAWVGYGDDVVFWAGGGGGGGGREE